jgi:hypothetical protein
MIKYIVVFSYFRLDLYHGSPRALHYIDGDIEGSLQTSLFFFCFDYVVVV